MPEPTPTVPPKRFATKKTAAWLATCIACVGAFEGLRTVAYKDPVGIPTICFGETRGVKMGDQATREQCQKMLGLSLQEFHETFVRCTGADVVAKLHPLQEAAYVSFIYNVGPGKVGVKDGFCELKGAPKRTSTMLTHLKAGRYEESCKEFPKWATAIGGVPLRGLTLRRAEEMKMCLEGARALAGQP